MNLTIDETIKHRIVGVVVLMALGAIVAPLLMKQSIQRFQDKQLVMVMVPPKPLKPHVVVPDERILFKRMKVARVNLPVIDKPAMAVALADATSLVKPTRSITDTKTVAVSQKLHTASSGPKSFAVQVAAFFKEDNAVILAQQLKKKGYPAFYVKRPTKNTVVYTVRVGTFATSDEAAKTQAILAKKMRLKGYVFNTQGVG